MNIYQRKIARETKKRLDLDTKVDSFSKQLEEMTTVGDIEGILEQIDMLPSWYEVKKQVSKDLKKKK